MTEPTPDFFAENAKNPAEQIDLAVEAQFFAALSRHYVQRADARQKAMGLQYTEAETHDLAKFCAHVVKAIQPTGEMRERDIQFLTAALSWYDGTEAAEDVRGAWKRLLPVSEVPVDVVRRAFCSGYRCAGEDANRSRPVGWERLWQEHLEVHPELVATPQPQQDAGSGGWRCFHCGGVFTDISAARVHFGVNPAHEPGCVERMQLSDLAIRKRLVDVEENARTLYRQKRALEHELADPARIKRAYAAAPAAAPQPEPSEPEGGER